MPYPIMLTWIWLATLLRGLMGLFKRPTKLRPFAPKRASRPTWTSPTTRFRPKPDWITRELVRIKAWTPAAGCRRIADTFNRRHQDDGCSVSKSFVAKVLKQHGEAIVRLRQRLRRRKPRMRIDRNASWGMDMTFVTGADRKQRMLLGLVDHGTRWCLALKELSDKRALTVWRELIALFRQYGIPKRIRVDNEKSFNAGWLKFGLGLLGVRIHATAPFSPWQNGKIERLFKTFKTDFRRVVEGDLTQLLKEWRWVYNRARPHMGIDYRTPAEAWTGTGRVGGAGERISLWNGALRAFYFPD